jgi:hypothetical protein
MSHQPKFHSKRPVRFTLLAIVPSLHSGKYFQWNKVDNFLYLI